MEIQKADPQLRRRAIMIAAIAVVAGAALIYLFQSNETFLQDWVRREAKNTMARLRWIFIGLAVALTVPPLAFAGYLWRLGQRVRNAARFPPAGTAVLIDTVVLTGDVARRRGWVFQILGALLAFSAIAMLYFLGKLLAGTGLLE
jgi:hypothetical protein